MDIPGIADIQRLRFEPGDSLVVRVDALTVSREDAEVIRQELQAVLKFPDDLPVLVHGRGSSLEVVSNGRAGPR